MLSVCAPGRRELLRYPASLPGRVVPHWVNAVPAPRPLGQLPVVGVEDLAELALRRCHEGLQSGAQAVSVQAYAAIMRLAWQIEHDEAIPARDEALPSWQRHRQRC